MPWITITTDDLKSALNAEELEIYSTHAADATDVDRADDIVLSIISQVRGDIATCSRNKLSIDPSLIPDAYVTNALAIARYRLLSTLPYCTISDSRTREYDTAVRFFDSVAKATRRPEPPSPDQIRDNTAPTYRPQSAQVVSSRTKITGRSNMSGL